MAFIAKVWTVIGFVTASLAFVIVVGILLGFGWRALLWAWAV